MLSHVQCFTAFMSQERSYSLTVRWRKQREAGRQAEQRHWHRDRWIQRERQTSAHTNNRERTGRKMLRARAQKRRKKRLIEERREEKESDREVLYHIHHVVFKWLRVVMYEGGTHINQTQKWGLGTHSSQLGICRYWCLKKFILIKALELKNLNCTCRCPFWFCQ